MYAVRLKTEQQAHLWLPLLKKNTFSDRTTIVSQETSRLSVPFLLSPKVYSQSLITCTYLLVLSRNRAARLTKRLFSSENLTSVSKQTSQKSVFVTLLTPRVYPRFTVLHYREPCQCGNTGQVIGGSTCSLPRETDTEHDHSAVSVCHALPHFCTTIRTVTLHTSVKCYRAFCKIGCISWAPSWCQTCFVERFLYK